MVCLLSEPSKIPIMVRLYWPFIAILFLVKFFCEQLAFRGRQCHLTNSEFSFSSVFVPFQFSFRTEFSYWESRRQLLNFSLDFNTDEYSSGANNCRLHFASVGSFCDKSFVIGCLKFPGKRVPEVACQSFNSKATLLAGQPADFSRTLVTIAYTVEAVWINRLSN